MIPRPSGRSAARCSRSRIRHGLAAFPDEPHRLRLELPRERPPLPFGHDTLLPHFRTIWGVHETGADSRAKSLIVVALVMRTIKVSSLLQQLRYRHADGAG